jgi:hypothetical protein
MLCINFDGFLLKMRLAFFLPLTDCSIYLDGIYCLVCLNGMILINLDTFMSMFLHVNFNCKTTFAMLIGTWRTT